MNHVPKKLFLFIKSIYNIDKFRKLKEIGKIDYLFFTNNFLSNIGALPLLSKEENFKETKIYATTPVAKLGFYTEIDSYISKIESTEFHLMNDSDISSAFLNIMEVKFKENIKLTYHNTEIIITPVPSGQSLGGCAWKLNYKLYSIVYAPQFSIENKFICDPFPYELIKNPDLFITDAKCSSRLPVERIVIENEFRKNILDSIEKQKNIFIPSDIVNIGLEMVIRLEKILDEFYSSKNINKEDLLKKENPTISFYKVLVCGYTSYEMIESVKSLIEFMGSAISKQFYSYNENPFNLQ